MNKYIPLALIASLILVASCSKAPAEASAPSATAPAVTVTDNLTGQWNGPEGTFLHLAGSSGQYAITIRNLDGPRSFQGRGTASGIVFERDGKTETLQRGSGAATGKKWLADKKDCIVIAPG
jgi:hypothetical protein